jgi:PST family polysaccharide transporter
MVTSQGMVFGIQVGSQVLLARLLSPADFGLIAMTAVFVNFITLFRDIGLGQATVQREHITDEQVSTLHWINGYLSCAIALLIALSSPVIAWIYREPRLVWITIAIAGPVAITGFNSQYHSLIQRNLRFKSLGSIQAACAFIGAATGIVSAYLGMGA